MPNCDNCSDKCPQAELAHNAALGRMYATNEFVKLVKKIESGELVEVVHGRWERDEWGSFLRRCSVCKKYPVYKNERGIGVAVYAGFCFNCGAKMDIERRTDGKG